MQSLGGEHFLEKCRRDILSNKRGGLNMFGDDSGLFADPFRIFHTIFRVGLKIFSGAISFCRCATLRDHQENAGCYLREDGFAESAC